MTSFDDSFDMSHDEDMMHGNDKKHRTIFSSEQKAALEQMFVENPFPDKKMREELATRIGVSNPKSVDYWFGHRRAKNRSRLRMQGGEQHVPQDDDEEGSYFEGSTVPDFGDRRSSADADEEDFNHVMYGHGGERDDKMYARKPNPPSLVPSRTSLAGSKRSAGDAFTRPENSALEQLWIACLLNHFYLEPRTAATVGKQQQ
jgi:hypothetical protein